MNVMSRPIRGIQYYTDLIQGSDEWLAARRGLLTASEMRLILNPPPKVETRIKKNGEPYKQREQTAAENEACRAHLYELLAQRINGYVEPHYISDDMLRGVDDEVEARILYEQSYAPVQQMGFITNDKWGFTLGFSPDGLVGEGGFIECKSRRQKYQLETIIENVLGQTIPADYLLQQQTGHLVSERGWCDFISYSGGMPMATIRVYPDPKVQNAIVEASGAFEMRLAEKMERYRDALASGARLIPTERRVEQEMHL
jgi:YqaJ-like viral recombinase domain